MSFHERSKDADEATFYKRETAGLRRVLAAELQGIFIGLGLIRKIASKTVTRV